MMDEKYMKVSEAAEVLHVRMETIRRYIEQGVLAAITLPGGDYRIAESELHKFVKQPRAEVKNGNI
jgi:excisionase family DNA binding protein